MRVCYAPEHRRHPSNPCTGEKLRAGRWSLRSWLPLRIESRVHPHDPTAQPVAQERCLRLGILAVRPVSIKAPPAPPLAVVGSRHPEFMKDPLGLLCALLEGRLELIPARHDAGFEGRVLEHAGNPVGLMMRPRNDVRQRAAT